MTRTLGDLMRDLEESYEKTGELLKKLPASIRIKQIWPEAFENDSTCSPVLIGTQYPGENRKHATYPPPYQQVDKITRTYLRRESDGVERDITISEFFSIWGHEVDE